jgi:prepilin-type processing-associated H-X9-DG protein
MLAYVQDYDEKFPQVRGNGIPHDPGYGWAGSIQPYLRSTQVLHCPLLNDPPARDTSYADYTDYWYNNRLSGVSQAMLNYVSNDISMGDGNDGHDLTDARYSKSQLPPDWITDRGKPSHRHLNGANYAFTDGHIKWLYPTVPTTAAAASSVFTFGVG